MRLSSATAAQGALLQAELRSDSQLEKLEAKWADRVAPFWTDEANENIQRGLLGIDLEQKPGRYELSVSAQLGNGQSVSCSGFVDVLAGKFAVERLKVDEKFVQLNSEDLARAEKEQQRLLELFAQMTPERLWKGRFRLPLDGVTTGSNFGRRRVLNGEPRSPHSGVDFPAAAGTPVHAAQGGRVVLAEPLFYSGNTVIIDHGLGIFTLYAHLETFSVAAGDVVNVGAVIGEVGATGRVTGPHLHWGLTVDGAKVNPLQIVGLR